MINHQNTQIYDMYITYSIYVAIFDYLPNCLPCRDLRMFMVKARHAMDKIGRGSGEGVDKLELQDSRTCAN